MRTHRNPNFAKHSVYKSYTYTLSTVQHVKLHSMFHHVSWDNQSQERTAPLQTPPSHRAGIVCETLNFDELDDTDVTFVILAEDFQNTRHENVVSVVKNCNVKCRKASQSENALSDTS